MKFLKTLPFLVFIGISLLSLILFFSFEDVEFTVVNHTDIPLKAYITMSSSENTKEYVYPLLGGEYIRAGDRIKTFYTLKRGPKEMSCKNITFKNQNEKIIFQSPCPQKNNENEKKNDLILKITNNNKKRSP